jgi:hypothetical protein
VIAGSVGTLYVAQLALETEIDDLIDVLGLELFGIDLGIFLIRTVGIDSVEKFGKAAAVSNAQTAVGAEAKDTLLLRAQILCIVITGIGGIISGIIAHKYPPLSIIANNSQSPKAELFTCPEAGVGADEVRQAVRLDSKKVTFPGFFAGLLSERVEKTGNYLQPSSFKACFK